MIPRIPLVLFLLLSLPALAFSRAQKESADEGHGGVSEADFDFRDLYNTIIFMTIVWMVGRLGASIGVPSVRTIRLSKLGLLNFFFSRKKQICFCFQTDSLSFRTIAQHTIVFVQNISLSPFFIFPIFLLCRTKISSCPQKWTQFIFCCLCISRTRPFPRFFPSPRLLACFVLLFGAFLCVLLFFSLMFKHNTSI
jgi:hypothetical protein